MYTLRLSNIAMENGPFIDDFPIKTSIYKGFSMAMLNNQMVLMSHHLEVDLRWFCPQFLSEMRCPPPKEQR